MSLPFNIEDVACQEAEERKRYFLGDQLKSVRVGPHGYFFPQKYREEAENIYNLPLRSDDIFVVTFPRSGTTLVQELVWLLVNDLNFEAAKLPLGRRTQFLEFSIHFTEENIKYMWNNCDGDQKSTVELFSRSASGKIQDAPSPRVIKSHLPLSLLPDSSGAKVVYIARDPRDAAVSYYHHNRLVKLHEFVGDFKTFWNFFVNDLVYSAPYFAHVKEAWARRHLPNTLFMFYEEFRQDLRASVIKLADFLDKKLSDEDLKRLCDHASLDSFKKNSSLNLSSLGNFGLLKNGEEPFIRKGEVGSWRKYFDSEMTEQVECWMEDNLRGTDLRYPEME